MNPNQNLSDNDIENAGQPRQASPIAPVSTPPAGDYSHPIASEKPNKPYHKLKIILVVGLILAALIAALAIVLYVASSSTKPAQEAEQTETTEAIEPITAEETIENIAAYFKGQEKARSSITIPVKAKDKNFYTVIPDIADLKSIAGYMPADKSTAQRESIEKSLDYDKFTKKVFSEGDDDTNYLADFTRSDVVCQLSVDISEREEKGDWVEISCLDTEDYIAYADNQQPLVSAYTAVVSTAAQYGFIGKITTKDGALTGYKLVEIPASSVIDQRMSTNDNLALFYQSPDGLWHYFRDRNRDVLVECENYNSEALRKAYADQPCRDRSSGETEAVKYSGKRE